MNLADVRRSQLAALSVTQTAGLLGVDERTVSRACEDGQLPSIRVGRRLLIPRLPLLALLGALPEGNDAAGADTPTASLSAVPAA